MHSNTKIKIVFIGKKMIGKKRGTVTKIANGFVYIGFLLKFFIHGGVHSAQHEKGLGIP